MNRAAAHLIRASAGRDRFRLKIVDTGAEDVLRVEEAGLRPEVEPVLLARQPGSLSARTFKPWSRDVFEAKYPLERCALLSVIDDAVELPELASPHEAISLPETIELSPTKPLEPALRW